jgi:hypothetical protein
VKPRTLGFVATVAVLAAATAVVIALRARRPPPPRVSAQELAALTRERDELQLKWREAVVANGERSLALAPEADLMIGLPTTLTASIVEQVVAGVFGRTTLTLKDLRVRKAGQVKAKLLFARRTLGEYAVEMRIHRVRGRLQAGVPSVSFGGGKVGVVLPVRLAGGEGEADMHFRWKSKGLADLVCDDVDARRGITGSVVPEDYQLRGSFAIAAAGDSIHLRPDFPELAMRIAVEPSPQAWAVVDDVIADRSKGCEIALDMADVKEKLGRLLGRGFVVKIPQKILEPIRLPAGFRRSLRLHGVDLALNVKPTGVLVADDRLWYGANVSVKARRR